MSISRQQVITILGFGFLFILLLSFRSKPKDLIQREKKRALNITSTDVNILRSEAISELSSDDKARIRLLENEIAQAPKGEKDDVKKRLSAAWYQLGQAGIAGYYAQEIAESLQTPTAWSIAGTTYAACINQTKKDKERTFCLENAIISIENAISLDPDNIDHKINRAVLLAENPPQDNPMTGVLQLLELNRKNPKNVTVINKIATFALQTNQIDKAEQRLLTAIGIEPNNQTSNCLLAELYVAKGRNDQAEIYQKKCGYISPN